MITSDDAVTVARLANHRRRLTFNELLYIVKLSLTATFSPSFQVSKTQLLTSAVSVASTPLRLLAFWNVMTTVAAAVDPFRCTVWSLTRWADPPLDRIDLEVCNTKVLFCSKY